MRFQSTLLHDNYLTGLLSVIVREPDNASRRLWLLVLAGHGVLGVAVDAVALVVVGHEEEAEGDGLAWNGEKSDRQWSYVFSHDMFSSNNTYSMFRKVYDD